MAVDCQNGDRLERQIVVCPTLHAEGQGVVQTCVRSML